MLVIGRLWQGYMGVMINVRTSTCLDHNGPVFHLTLHYCVSTPSALSPQFLEEFMNGGVEMVDPCLALLESKEARYRHFALCSLIRIITAVWNRVDVETKESFKGMALDLIRVRG